MIRKQLNVNCIDAALIVSKAASYESKITIKDDDNNSYLNAKSLIGMMLLSNTCKSNAMLIELIVDGVDEKKAVTDIEKILTAGEK